MTTEEIHDVADALLRELEAIEGSPEARSYRRVLVNLALQGVHSQTLVDMRQPPT